MQHFEPSSRSVVTGGVDALMVFKSIGDSLFDHVATCAFSALNYTSPKIIPRISRGLSLASFVRRVWPVSHRAGAAAL
jgi:hypothetical protein